MDRSIVQQRQAGAVFFSILSGFAPALPPGAHSPLLWGTEEHVRTLVGPKVESLKMTRQEYVERAGTSCEYFELFKHTFGPMVAIYESPREQPTRSAEFDSAFLQFIARWNRDASGGSVQIPYEYLLIVAEKIHA